MWKYVSRRIRDTFERSANHFDKRSTTGLTNATNNVTEEKKKRANPPCCWFSPRKCWNSFQSENDTHNKGSNFEQLNRTWIGAITWSGALVLGWYTSQLIHLKLKYYSKDERSTSKNKNIFTCLHPYVSYVNKETLSLNSISKIEKLVGKFTPTVHSVSNDDHVTKDSDGSNASSSDTRDSSDVLGDVLNSIENKLGLAAIESGQHKDGLNLLRSAANRNHGPALYNLGLCYEMGLGVAIDEKMAVDLYRSAAALEHPGALYNLGIYYGQGRGGITPDTETATRLLRLAAVKGQQDAIDALKVLQDETVSPNSQPSNNWNYNYSSYEENDMVLSAQTALFEKNASIMHIQNGQAAVY